MGQNNTNTENTVQRKPGRFLLLRQIGIFVLIFYSAILFFCTVNIGAALVPINETWKKNALETYGYEKERGYYPSTGMVRLDNYTDILILSIAFAMDPEHPVDSGMLGRYYIGEKDKDFLNSMKELLLNGPKAMKATYYSRYWHGQSPFMRLLHFKFTLSQIYPMIGTVTLLLSMVAFALVLQRYGKTSAFAIFSLLALCAFQAFFLSLQYYPVLWIGLVSLISMMLIPNRHARKYIFFVTGMFCAHLDLLTAPMLTLGIPALFLCSEETRACTAKGFRAFLNWMRVWIGYPLLWLIGYSSCWGTKILLGGLLEGSFEGARRQFAFRLSLSYGDRIYTRPGALLHNCEMLINNNLFFLYLLIAIFLILLLVAIINLCRGKVFFDYKLFIGYLMLACMPVALVMTLANHTEIHTYFTFRGLSVSFIALFLLVTAFRAKQIPGNQSDAETPPGPGNDEISEKKKGE